MNHLYLLNYSACVLLKNVVYIVAGALKITYIAGVVTVSKLNVYLMYVLLPLTYSLCYTAVLVLAADRIFLALHGSNVYVFSSWDRTRGRSLVLLLWGFVVVVFVVMFEVVGIFHDVIKIVAMYLIAIVDVLCVVVVMLMYVSVHKILVKTRSKLREAIRRFPDFEDRLTAVNSRYSFRAAVRSVQYYFLPQIATSGGRNHYNKRDTYGHTLQQSPFFTTVLVTSCFLLLVVLPSVILAVFSIAHGKVDEDLVLFVHICACLSDTVTGFAYILTYQSLFKVFVMRLNKTTRNDTGKKTTNYTDFLINQQNRGHRCPVITLTKDEPVKPMHCNSNNVAESEEGISPDHDSSDDDKLEELKSHLSFCIAPKNNGYSSTDSISTSTKDEAAVLNSASTRSRSTPDSGSTPESRSTPDSPERTGRKSESKGRKKKYPVACDIFTHYSHDLDDPYPVMLSDEEIYNHDIINERPIFTLAFKDMDSSTELSGRLPELKRIRVLPQNKDLQN